MNLAAKPPLGLKPPKVKPDPAYLAKVRAKPCVCCGVYGVEAHHCRDLPDHNERGLYQRLPGAAQKSGDRDAIPLCQFHHRMFHLERETFHENYGRDYSYIGPTRAAITEQEIDY